MVASKSREMNRGPTLYQMQNAAQQSTEMSHGPAAYSSAGLSSDNIRLAKNRRHQPSKDLIDPNRTGETMMNFDGSEPELNLSQPQNPTVLIGSSHHFKTNAANRSGGIIFSSSGHTSQSQSRGSGIALGHIGGQAQQQPARQHRLMTSQGPRRAEQSTTLLSG